VESGVYPLDGSLSNFRRAFLQNWQLQWSTAATGRSFFTIKSTVSLENEFGHLITISVLAVML
jgi:hypothetical protein